jgi:hypothetical protein
MIRRRVNTSPGTGKKNRYCSLAGPGAAPRNELTVSLSMAELRNAKYSRRFGAIPPPSESQTSLDGFVGRTWSALKLPSATKTRRKTNLKLR